MSKLAHGFTELNLAHPLVKAVTELGYEATLPVQSACIPHLLEGKDVLGLAQTGTGKTAAFALPLLSNIDLSNRSPQVLVLTPTRELANQVAEAFQTYARHLRGFHVLPIYGGQRYSFQFSQLHRGPQVVVGTPGRIQDHINRGTLDLSGISCVVLDEADEMLRMGFIEEVEAILSETPDKRQMALFSATLPPQIKRIAKRYMNDAVEVSIEGKTTTADNIEQVYLVVHNASKFETLVRLLETESYDGILIFARTRVATNELAEKLASRGFDVAALNGDMSQIIRERTVKRLKNGGIDIVVATDVAARGLDVDRISLVVNYDIPGDSEAYTHRIGRTGRVGRYGKAILFVNTRERRLLSSIERATRQPLRRMDVPSYDDVTQVRIGKFREKLAEVIADEPLGFFRQLSVDMVEDLNIDLMQLASGALCLAQQERPLRPDGAKPEARQDETSEESKRGRGKPGRSMALYRIEVGSAAGAEVQHILVTITNETGLKGRRIGQIRIHPKYSTVELPDNLAPEILEHLQTAQVAQQPMRLSRVRDESRYRSAGSKGRQSKKAKPHKAKTARKAKKGKLKKKARKPKAKA